LGEIFLSEEAANGVRESRRLAGTDLLGLYYAATGAASRPVFHGIQSPGRTLNSMECRSNSDPAFKLSGSRRTGLSADRRRDSGWNRKLLMRAAHP
jgi:hypothetical protein